MQVLLRLRRLPRPVRLWMAGLLIVLAGALAYSNSFRGPFIFDDINSTIDNPTIRRLWPLDRALSPPEASGMTVSGRPLLNLSFAVSYALSRTEVWGYHALNLAIHLLAALLLFALVRRALEQPESNDRLGPEAIAFVAAVLFVLHPLQTASVTYVVQRAESLMSALLLLTLYCFARAMSSPRRDRWLVAAVIACLGGMAAKESMAAAPLLVLLYDRTFHTGNFRAALRARPRFYTALFATWGLLAYLVLASKGRGGSVGFGAAVSPWSYALTQIFAVTHYIWLAVWPDPLVFDYGQGLVRPSSLALAARALFLIDIVAGTFFALRRWPRAGFLGVCFFAVLAPTSSVVPVITEPIAEHRMYLPLAALLVLGAAGAWRWLGRRGVALLLLLTPVYGWATFQRNELYRDPVALWQDTLEKWPNNLRAAENLADALSDDGRFEAAIALYRDVVRKDPSSVSAYSRMGLALYSLGRVDEASVQFHKALEIAPGDSIATYNLGNIFLQGGHLDEAIRYYKRALANRPDYQYALANLGTAYFAKNLFQEAVQSYRHLSFPARLRRRLWLTARGHQSVGTGGHEHPISLRLAPRPGRAGGGQDGARGGLLRRPDLPTV